MGFIDNVNPERKGDEFCGKKILGGKKIIPSLITKEINHILLGFGDCKVKIELTPWLFSLGFKLPIAIHPKAAVSKGVVIGPGTVIVAGAIVNTATEIGRNVIINTSASVDHECTIGDSVHIGPGSNLGGRVTIGQATHIGIGSTIIDKITIGSGSVIGAGSVVVEDIPDNVIAYGVPARIIRKVKN